MSSVRVRDRRNRQEQISGGCPFTSQEAAMKAASLQDAFSGLGFGVGATHRRRGTGGLPGLSPALAEALEWRRLLTVSFSAGVITVNGTSLGDTIIAYQELVPGTTTKQVRILDNGAPSAWFTGVTQINVNGFGGGDDIVIETDDNHPNGTLGVDANTRILAGPGND